jgi:hypothetical protein
VWQASIAEDPARLEVLRSSLASTYPALAAAAAAKLQQLSHTKAGVSAPPAGAPPAVRTYGVWRPRLLTTLVFDKPPVLRDAGVTPAPPVFVARDAGSDDAAAGSSTGSATSAPAVAPSAAQTHLPYNVRLAALTAALEADGAGPAPPPLLPTPFQPLAWTSPASWIGTRRMQLARGPSAASSGEEDATPALFDTGGGLTFDVSAMKSDASSSSAAGAAAGVGSGGGAAPGGAPAAGAAGGAADGRALIAKLKRPMLRMMGAGAEDCVVGYWRFEQRDGDDVSPYDVADLTKHSNNASIRGRGVGADTVRLEACDAPVDHGDPDRVKQPRALVLGPVGADSDGGKAAALFAALSASTLPSWPSADDVAPYAMIAPVPAWGYFDVGMRPEDPVTASFTVEVWVKLGSNVSSAVVVEEGDTPGVDGAGSGAKAGSSASPAPTVLAMRLEPAGPSSLRPQWAIVVEDGGVLAFRSYAAPSGAVETVRTPPGSLQKGVWTHLAVVVDGSSVARSGGKGGGGGGRGGGGFGGGDDDGDDVDRGPCCAVSMFIKGNQAARGFVANGAPYTSDVRPRLLAVVTAFVVLSGSVRPLCVWRCGRADVPPGARGWPQQRRRSGRWRRGGSRGWQGAPHGGVVAALPRGDGAGRGGASVGVAPQRGAGAGPHGHTPGPRGLAAQEARRADPRQGLLVPQVHRAAEGGGGRGRRRGRRCWWRQSKRRCGATTAGRSRARRLARPQAACWWRA